MADGNHTKQPRGFAGLRSMVSQVETVVSAHAVRHAHEADETRVRPSDIAARAASSGGSTDVLSPAGASVQKPPHGRDPIRAAKRLLYVCQRCGCLLHWLSDNCPSCGFAALDLDAALTGIALSNAYFFSACDLITAGRQIRAGASVPRAEEAVAAMKLNSAARDFGAQLVALASKNVGKEKARLPGLFRCPACSKPLTQFSIKAKCAHCGAAHGFTELKKALFFIRYMTWSMEYDLAVPASPAYGDLLAALVAMRDRILIKQEMPSESDRRELLALLAGFDSVPLEDRSITIMRDPGSGKAYVSARPGVVPTSSQITLANITVDTLTGLDHYIRYGIPQEGSARNV